MKNNYTQFLLTSASYSTGPVRNDFHHHDDYEIIFVTEGQIEASINYKKYIIPENHLIFISNLEKHSIRQISGIYKRYWITLHTQVTDSYIRNPDLLNIQKNHTNTFCHHVDISAHKDLFLSLFEKIVNAIEHDIYSNDLISCYIQEMLIHVGRLEPERFGNQDTTCRNRILNIQKYLDANYDLPLRIDKLCELFYISNCYLSHTFKEVTGYSPKQYLTLVRLKHASILIHDTEKTIGDIAYSCGFSDINNFNKQFKRTYGCTPGEFRKL